MSQPTRERELRAQHADQLVDVGLVTEAFAGSSGIDVSNVRAQLDDLVDQSPVLHR